MKIIPVLALLTLMLTSCIAGNIAQPVAPTQTMVQSSSTTPILTPALARPREPSLSVAGVFVEPVPEIWVDVMPAVRAYLYYCTKAVVSRDVNGLQKRYSDLKQGMNVQTGIITEQNNVQTYRSLKPFDGNIFPEQYERIKVKINGDPAEIMVHGMEGYRGTLDPSKLDESGGEFRIILSRQKQDNLWTVDKTTDITGP